MLYYIRCRLCHGVSWVMRIAIRFYWPALTPPLLAHILNSCSLPFAVFHMFMMSFGNFQLPRVRFWLDYPLDFVHLNSAHGCNMKDCRLIRITTIIPCTSFTSPIRQVGRWRQKRPWERTRRSLGWMDPLDAQCKINSKDHWAISKAVEEPNQSPKPEGVGSWKWLLSMELGKKWL